MPYDAYGQWYDGPPELPVLGGPIPPLQANYESATGSLPPGRMTPPMMAPYSPAPGVFQSPPGFGNFGLQSVLRPENEIRAQMYGATG